ncbi:oxidoreductase [Corynespora cassiicola Philippines]|uniref:Oxidoreductase n=1 Tax=Corynespora cassiicola Philippines TaxID=1448308 RepID=A0A2T2NYH4_CORCC|nr:oxidoreductase [Corynespora cassiicola Philippines]
MSNTVDKFFSFPDDVTTAPLITVCLHKLLGGDVEEHARLFDACKTLGFFYLDLSDSDEGEELISGSNDLFDILQDFFQLPLQEKLKYDFASEGSYFGYKGMGAEVVDGAGTKDKNEIFNISKDDIMRLGQPAPAPEIIRKNRNRLMKYIEVNNVILETILYSLASSLQLPADALTSTHRLRAPSGCHIRFICAPPQQPDSESLALGEHTDFGSLTVLFNRIGGLQVQLPETAGWVYVRPMPKCAIINLGDAMVKFSAGILKSNLHRVVAPPGEQRNLVRYSLVYFSRPEYEVKMQRMQGGLVDQVMRKEEETPECTRDWLKRRHQGRKVQFFKDEATWEHAMGTEVRL